MRGSVLRVVVFLAVAGMAGASAMRCPVPLDRDFPVDLRLIACGGLAFSNLEGIDTGGVDAPVARPAVAEPRAGGVYLVSRVFMERTSFDESREPKGIGKVPEPASMLFLGTSFIALGMLRGRRHRR